MFIKGLGFPSPGWGRIREGGWHSVGEGPVPALDPSSPLVTQIYGALFSSSVKWDAVYLVRNMGGRKYEEEKPCDES